MFQGKKKAVTFSYDDGVTQDKRLIELFNRFHLKATFNLNSECLGQKNELVREGKKVNHTKNPASEVADIYRGHEVAVHTLTHPNLTQLEEKEIIRQVEEDRKNLEALVGYPVIGMAYPCGGVNNDARVASIIKNHTRIQYARTITSSHSFDLQENLYQFKPTVYHHEEWDKMFALLDEFLALKPDRPQLFYIWGHSYEFDIADTWGRMEEFCRRISRKDDIFYGTNRDVLL